MAGTFLTQYRIYRRDLQSNPNVLYVFGDNTKRKGMGGQAGEMRGEPNAVGVATKWDPSGTDPNGEYFSDDKYLEQIKIIKKDFEPVIAHLKRGGTVIFPEEGIGTGLSDLPAKSPRTMRSLDQFIEELRKRYSPKK